MRYSTWKYYSFNEARIRPSVPPEEGGALIVRLVDRQAVRVVDRLSFSCPSPKVIDIIARGNPEELDSLLGPPDKYCYQQFIGCQAMARVMDEQRGFKVNFEVEAVREVGPYAGPPTGGVLEVRAAAGGEQVSAPVTAE